MCLQSSRRCGCSCRCLNRRRFGSCCRLFGGGLGCCGFGRCRFAGRRRCLGCRFGYRFGSGLGGRLGSRFYHWFSRRFCNRRFCRSFYCRLCRCRLTRSRGLGGRDFGSGRSKLLYMLGQRLDLGMQRFDFFSAGYTQSGDGTVETLIESLFELAPFLQCQIFNIFNPRTGR